MRLPVVSIVGRPNVGKSSLFNRLARERVAIVDDTPGVTRDRIEREVNLGDYRVLLIDTGGVVASAEGMVKETVKQAKRAMEEADVIVFVVDGREGVTPLDEEVASILRKWKKPVVVAVNKVDEPFMESLSHEFYSLGFEKVVPVSALHKVGIPTLIDKVVQSLPDELRESARLYKVQAERAERLEEALRTGDVPEKPEAVQGLPIRVAIVGRPNTGKSTLLNAITGEERAIVSDVPGTTRDAIDSQVTLDRTDFVFIDTAGIRRRGKIKDLEYYSYLRALSAMDRADVVVLLIDAGEGPTDRDAKIAGMALEKFKPLVIAVNKVDLIEGERKWKNLHRELDMTFDFVRFAPRVFLSAKKKQGLKELIQQVKDLYSQYSSRVTTGRLNRVLEEVLSRHQPPVYRNKTVRIYYGTQVGVKPPTFLLFSNYPEGVTKAFRRFLENSLRQTLGFTKVPLRIVFKKR